MSHFCVCSMVGLPGATCCSLASMFGGVWGHLAPGSLFRRWQAQATMHGDLGAWHQVHQVHFAQLVVPFSPEMSDQGEQRGATTPGTTGGMLYARVHTGPFIIGFSFRHPQLVVGPSQRSVKARYRWSAAWSNFGQSPRQSGARLHLEFVPRAFSL